MILYLVFQAEFPTDFDGELIGIYDKESLAKEVSIRFNKSYIRKVTLNCTLIGD